MREQSNQKFEERQSGDQGLALTYEDESMVLSLVVGLVLGLSPRCEPKVGHSVAGGQKIGHLKHARSHQRTLEILTQRIWISAQCMRLAPTRGEDKETTCGEFVMLSTIQSLCHGSIWRGNTR